MVRQDHQKAEGQLVSNLDQQTASYDLRDTKKQLFYWRPCANLKCTGDNFSTILYGPNQLCINFLDNPFLVLGV